MSEIVIYLHLGLHKTGTTFLQRMLQGAPDWLKEQGYLYPKTGHWGTRYPTAPQSNPGHSEFFPAFGGSKLEARTALLRSLQDEISATGATKVILSSETFSHPKKDPRNFDFSELRKIGRIQPIFYLRRQDTYASSLYREVLGWATNRLTLTFDEWLDGPAEQWLDFETRMNRWAEVFGRQELIVRSYEDAVVGKGGIWQDFASLIGLKGHPPVSPEDPVNHYSSFNPAIVPLVLAANQRGDLSPEQRAQINWELKNDPHWQPTNEERAMSLISSGTWSKLAQKYRKMNQDLAESLIEGPSARFQFSETQPDCGKIRFRAEGDAASELSLELWPPVDTPPKTSPKVQAGLWRKARVGLVSLQRQSPEITKNWIRYHLSLGVERIILFSDDPNQPLPSNLPPEVSVVSCDAAYWKGRIRSHVLSERISEAFSQGFESLQNSDLDWIGFCDGDELLCGDIQDELDTVSPEVEVLRLRPMEAVLTSAMTNTTGFRSRWFRRLPEETPNALAERELLPNIHHAHHRSGFLGYTYGKGLVRRSADVSWFGSHAPYHAMRRMRTVDATKLNVLHFDAPDFPAWLKKWKFRFNGEATPRTSPWRDRQVNRIYQLLEKDNLNALRAYYRKIYLLDDKALEAWEDAGAVVNVQIPDAMFEG